MSVISVLPVSLRNKIAAGEVIERPASVVKELVENAIDAAGTHIVVETVHAGRKLIHVSDNGSGMDREDAVRAFERYATSKIRDEQELFNLKTMGFRGEALSSIAAVTKITLMTAVRNSPGAPGTCVEIAGGEITSIKECSAMGTSIGVRDLFFNTPARRKFLKSDATENYHIVDTVTREALSHPHIRFVLTMDGREVFSLPVAASLRERLLQLYGKEFTDGLIQCSSSDIEDSNAIGVPGKSQTFWGRAGMAVTVFTSALANMKNNKDAQFLFVNGRPVKDQSVTHAVYKAYEGLAPKEKHPVFFIFLGVDAAAVDFNVHPAKREVRFANKSSIFNFVCQTIKKALRSGPGFGIDSDFGRKDFPSAPAAVGYQQPNELATFTENLISEDAAVFSDGVGPLLYLGDTLIAMAGNGGLMLLDYHAAHERVNYERFLKRVELHTYRLLFPQQVQLKRGESAILIEQADLLHEAGLELSDFGHDTVLVRSIPDVLRDADFTVLLSDIASSLLELPVAGAPLPPLETMRRLIAARLACHSSIRGKEVPDRMRVAELLRSLDATDNPHSCPHGRPTRIFISPEELRKMFKK